MNDRPAHVLIVDDESCVREALELALRDRYLVHGAATGAEACAILRASPIAGIILDAVLGDEHGLDLVDRFHAISNAPILVLTGYSTEELAIQSLRAGAVEYLKKPMNLEELYAALARMIPDAGFSADPAAAARDVLDGDLSRHYSPASLAKIVGVSKSHLYRHFRAGRAKPPGRYVAERRLQRAAEMLLGTTMCIKEISWEVGYSSPVAFDRIFKRTFGVTPRDFRRRRGNIGPWGRKGAEPIED